MQNPRLATRYAKSLLDLAIEQQAVEPILKDMHYLKALCSASREFTQVLRSPVIKGDKKADIFTAVAGANISKITKAFVDLLIRKGREYFLPEMTQAYIQQYRDYKNIHAVQLTTAVQIDDTLRQEIHEKVRHAINEGTIDLTLSVDETLIGGFVLQVGDKLFDASIRRDLNDIKKQFTKNMYVADI